MTTDTPSNAKPRRSRLLGAAGAAAQATDRDTLPVSLPLLGNVHLPPPEHLAFYFGLGAMAALEIVEWPVAAMLAVGKALADSRSHATLRGFGEALESK